MARRAQSRTILHQSLKSFFQRDLGEKRNPLCLLIAVDMDGGELAMARQFEQPLLMVGVPSGGAPTLGRAPVSAVATGDPLRRNLV
jgi:hypothetical protein